MEYKDYKNLEIDGVINVIIHDGKVLLVKRRNVPFVIHRGAWALLTGARKKGERHIETAYREIKEESGLERKNLKKLAGPIKVYLHYDRAKIIWTNAFFIFRSDTKKIKLDFENSKYRWSTFNELRDEKDYTNMFMKKEKVLKMIKRCLNA